ncbi:MAG: hypothetical protein HOK63_02430 [Thaumarchaeota archaeon]|jgi:hypothetical protein|nr:hypothetical protein [Nitrososphaerota archaeon]MBT5843106.1 hypothetical protein [Nitrososphaerota archaeon]MBT6468495.1 hypothetical protein [Nitrososphaerota archaeon]
MNSKLLIISFAVVMVSTFVTFLVSNSEFSFVLGIVLGLVTFYVGIRSNFGLADKLDD